MARRVSRSGAAPVGSRTTSTPELQPTISGTQRVGSKCTRLSPVSQAVSAAPGTIAAVLPSGITSVSS